MIPAGTVERGERKRTVDEVSKADFWFRDATTPTPAVRENAAATLRPPFTIGSAC
jgi:hypothetical protein